MRRPAAPHPLPPPLEGEFLRTLRPDPYVLAILAMVVVASVVPVRGAFAVDFDLFTKLVIALLFFLHRVRLSREAVIAGHDPTWRLRTSW